ncbi:hypothetical protein [Pseudoalteromonas sp. HM-SA03]|uniref:hypothetical protein n=1 Tax=Pseudoalteromonas sp. HM-SA03 TaxID=2029678 RepID=UPI0015961CF1|nr:hypothetical protein [Pseudoalteromonas sp. HM-SA03]
MKDVTDVLNGLFNLPPQQQVFVIAALAILVAVFALYVVLTVIKNGKDKGE